MISDSYQGTLCHAKLPSTLPTRSNRAVMACLAIVQQEQGYVSAESEQDVAEYLGMPPMAVHEVTTFYNMYNQRPVGKYKLNVCTNLPCQLRNGQRRLHHLADKLGIHMGRNHGRRHVHFAAERVPGRVRRCAGAAGQRPHHVQFHDAMTKLDQLVDGLRAAEEQRMNPDASTFAVSGHRRCKPASMAATSTRRFLPA